MALARGTTGLPSSPKRRAALRIGAALGLLHTASWSAPADPAADPAPDAAAFDAAVRDRPWLVPFKGVVDGGAATGDLSCSRLAVTGRWPAELRGHLYRNGPALFERDGRRYRHWFDGDGMVQRFTFADGRVAHLGRLVQTPKLAAERKAGRFLRASFGTPMPVDEPMQGPDSINAANTNAIVHAGRVLALWEGGSAFALDPDDLSTIGPVTWGDGLAQVPFSAHPKVDADGNLWNFGTFADRIVVWQIDASGRLVRVQVTQSPYPHGMVHDVAITAQHLVLPLPPIRMDFDAIARGASARQAFGFDADEPLRILVMRKDDIARRRVFELPARMVFHVGNAHERVDGSIALTYVAADRHDFLVGGAVDLVAGRVAAPSDSTLQSAVLDMRTGRARVDALPGKVEFPRIDPRRIGRPAHLVASTAAWKDYGAARRALYHGVQVCDLRSGRADRYDYGEDAVVEEHLLVPKRRTSDERDAWLIGTTFDARRRVTSVNVLDARRVADGPIASATLPYWLPFGFHGNFSAA